MVDAILVKNAANGDMDAFGQIYETIYPKAVQYLRSMSRDEDTAEQVVQDTVVYFMQDDCNALKALQDYNRFEPYFFQAIKNRYFNLYRSKRTKGGDVREVYVDEIYDVEEDGELNRYFGVEKTMTPEQYAEHEEVKEILAGMIDELPDTQKEAFNLFVIGNMKQTEIAETMGVPLNTVKSYLQYAKKKLSAKITEYEKKNDIKLHSVLPILPFLRFMYGSEKITLPKFSQLCEAAGVSGTAAAATTGAAGTAIGTATAVAATAGTAVATKVGVGIATKVIAGIIAAAVVGVSAEMGTQLFKNKKANSATQKADYATEESTPIDTEYLSEDLMPIETISYDQSIAETVFDTLKKKTEEFKARNRQLDDDTYRYDYGNNYSESEGFLSDDSTKTEIYKDDKLVGQILNIFGRSGTDPIEEYSQGKLSPYDGGRENLFGYTVEKNLTDENGPVYRTEKYEHLTDNTYYYMKEDYWTTGKSPEETNAHRVEYFISQDKTVYAIFDSYIQYYLDRCYSQMQYCYENSNPSDKKQNSLALTKINRLNNEILYEVYDEDGVLIERNPNAAVDCFDMSIPVNEKNVSSNEMSVFDQLIKTKKWHYLTYFKNISGEVISFIWTFDFYKDGHFECRGGKACSGDIMVIGTGNYSVENGNLHLKISSGDEVTFATSQDADRIYLTQISENGLNFTNRKGFETVLRMGDISQYHNDEMGRIIED